MLSERVLLGACQDHAITKAVLLPRTDTMPKHMSLWPLPAEAPCDAGSTLQQGLSDTVCTPANAFGNGCPFMPDTLLGVCSKKVTYGHHAAYGDYVSWIEAWNTPNGKAIAALRISFNKGKPITFGDVGVTTAQSASASMPLSKQGGAAASVWEIRMWYSEDVDYLGRAQLAAIYIKSDSTHAMLGNKNVDFNDPDKLLTTDEINMNFGDLGSGLLVGELPEER